MEEGAISGKEVHGRELFFAKHADTERQQARVMSGGTGAYQCASTYELLTRQISKESRTRYISGRCRGVVSAGLGRVTASNAGSQALSASSEERRVVTIWKIKTWTRQA